MMKRLRSYLGLVWAYVRINFAAQLEYRAAFASEVAAMIINDAVWVTFWVLFFTRFPVLRGWDVRDVITVWALSAVGFGMAHAVYGNAIRLPSLIADGHLDAWMLYPRALLPHMLLGKMLPSAWGDVVFGFAVYLGFVRPDLPHFALFVALGISAAMLFVGFGVLSASLGFYLGNSAALTEQWRSAMITFSTYPAAVFQGAVKILLFTAIPAAFITLLPVEALRTLSVGKAALAILGSAAVLVLGVTLFHHGLKRYESGNLLALRD
jgi:ABC-2 type transport system permease protein